MTDKETEIREKIERIRQWLFYNSTLNEKGNSKDYELDLLQAEAKLEGIQEIKKEMLEDEIEFLERFDLRDMDSIEVIDWKGDEIWADKYIKERLQALKSQISKEKESRKEWIEQDLQIGN